MTERLPLSVARLWSEELPPVTLGGYLELGDVLGEGGMGTVFAAWDTRLHRRVAVKLLPPHLAGQAEFRARFDREARAMARLSHPHVVSVFDFGHDGDQSYIVMELVEGRPLSELLPLPPARAVEVVRQVCDALAYAHAQGLVHRDIKPDNILVSPQGWIKVADFGIARMVREREGGWTLTTPDKAVGTPQYMAPEVREGAPPDPRLDVYSVGVLLFRAIAGHFPSGDLDALPTRLRPVVRRALATDPAQRFAHAGELRSALPATSDDAEHTELPPDQRAWLRAVALLQTLASAVALWAFWLCVTPQVMEARELKPLITMAEPLPDGRWVSWARFEIWPVLAAAAASAGGIVAYGLLRRHWRLAGLERNAPQRDIPQVRRVLVLGALATAVYLVHVTLLARTWVFDIVMPIAGGVWELIILWYFWMALLELWRHQRPLHREWRLGMGMALAWVPPAADLLRYLATWRPL